ncbi:MAG: shikimate kinase AroK [Pseudomonadota bacterium]|nr:shikimate kinase AroK [Pseudomonadota bacterium]
MGAGKTAVGRQLARRLKRQFLDSDHELERRTGVDIPTIFEFEGEEGFRSRENAVIDELTRGRGIVLATGGGAVLDPDNRRHLAARGTVIYLCTTIDTQLARTSRDRNRPLLQTSDPRTRLESLMAIRDPLYREISDIVVSTDNSRMPALVNNIIKRLETL